MVGRPWRGKAEERWETGGRRLGEAVRGNWVCSVSEKSDNG